MDFFSEIRLIWDIVKEVGVGNYGTGEGFPPAFEYRWADPKNRTPTACSGPQYVQFAIDWIELEINNESLFPTAPSKFSLSIIL